MNVRETVEAPAVLATDEFQAFPNRDRFFVGGIPGINIFAFSTVLPMVFLREHNRIAEAIHRLKPGEKQSIGLPLSEQPDPVAYDVAIYQLARKVVTAEMQAITYQEYLPALGVELSPYNGYDDTPFPSAERNGPADCERPLSGAGRHLQSRAGARGRCGCDSSRAPRPDSPGVDLKVIDGLRNLSVPGLVADLLADDIQAETEASRITTACAGPWACLLSRDSAR